MNELITVSYDNEQPTVLGRDLHEALEVNSNYTTWFNRMCEYGFNEGKDFLPILEESTGGRKSTNHQLTIPMAKEICMLQRTDKGREFRQYFIAVEQQWNTPEAVMARALRYANESIDKLKESNSALEFENAQQKQIIGELKPKADYTDRILHNKGLVTITQIAKDYGMTGTQLNQKLKELHIQYKQSGQWLLYAKYHSSGYTHSKTIDIVRRDGSPDTVMETKWTQKGRLFIYDALKAINILPMIERQ